MTKRIQQVGFIVAFTIVAACSQPEDESADNPTNSHESHDVGTDSSVLDADTASEDAALDSAAEENECGSPDDYVRGQYQVEELEGCDIFLGNINLGDYTGIDFSFFPPLRVVEGTLSLFRNEYLESLHGLESLERLGELNLRLSVVLDDVTALSNLRAVDRRLIVDANLGLTQLRGFGSLRSVGELRITDNPKLESLDGLDGLESVHGDVTISNNNIPQDEVQAFVDRVEIDGETHVEF